MNLPINCKENAENHSGAGRLWFFINKLFLREDELIAKVPKIR